MAGKSHRRMVLIVCEGKHIIIVRGKGRGNGLAGRRTNELEMRARGGVILQRKGVVAKSQ